jgi:peptide/nickel transport system ATP-binding protein
VGESGSGKTTLARVVVGLHRSWSGEVAFEGTALARTARQRPREALRQVQFVFQNPYGSLNPRRLVGEIVEQPLRRLLDLGPRERAARVIEALEDAALGAEFRGRYPGELSGGERQRVAIARALAVGPKVLVCDEITSSLDVSVQAAIIEMLRRLQRDKGLALLFITHNLALVRSIAQQVSVVQRGVIVESGPSESVLEAPRAEYTRTLLRDIPVLRGAA